MPPEAIIFDFDGVIADSEVLANRVLAEMVTALGRSTSLDNALDRYMGKRLPDLITAIEMDLGRPLAGGFARELQATTLKRFRKDLCEVRGARAFLDSHLSINRCIASSSSRERLTLSLEVLDLGGYFADHVFSADQVARGKPYPDLFLLAANALGANPAGCVVIEDSVSGVSAGIAAGMKVIGLYAGSHIRPGHGERLLQAGAHYVAKDWNAVAAIIGKAAPA